MKRELDRRPRWVSVDERLPEEFTESFVKTIDGGRCIGMLCPALSEAGYGEWIDTDDYLSIVATHWLEETKGDYCE